MKVQQHPACQLLSYQEPTGATTTGLSLEKPCRWRQFRRRNKDTHFLLSPGPPTLKGTRKKLTSPLERAGLASVSQNIFTAMATAQNPMWLSSVVFTISWPQKQKEFSYINNKVTWYNRKSLLYFHFSVGTAFENN